MAKFSIPLQTEVSKYIREKTKWPEEFCNHYADKFWNHYQASGWKLSSGNSVKDWKACFNSQWQQLKFKEDIDLLNKLAGARVIQMNANPEGDIERLDDILRRYNRAPSAITIEKLSSWDGLDRIYDTIKKNRLWDERITKQELSAFNEPQKVKAYVVIRTLDYYGIKGWTFSDTIKLRKHG